MQLMLELTRLLTQPQTETKLGRHNITCQRTITRHYAIPITSFFLTTLHLLARSTHEQTPPIDDTMAFSLR
jgi:hypothetical protein